MTSVVKEQKNIFFRFGSGVISFVVGLSAFFIIKLAFMISLNLLITKDNVEKMEGVGALLIIFSIYLAVKYTKNLNKNKSKKTRIVKRVITIVIGFICMVITTTVITMSKNMSNNKELTITPQVNVKPESSVFVVTRVNGESEFYQENFTEEALESIEKWMKEKTIVSIKEEYEKNGFDFNTFDKKTIKSNSSYLIVDKVKLAIIRIYSGTSVNSVAIKGVKDKKLYTIICMRKDAIEVNYLGGKCGEKIQSIFNISLLNDFINSK